MSNPILGSVFIPNELLRLVCGSIMASSDSDVRSAELINPALNLFNPAEQKVRDYHLTTVKSYITQIQNKLEGLERKHVHFVRVKLFLYVLNYLLLSCSVLLNSIASVVVKHADTNHDQNDVIVLYSNVTLSSFTIFVHYVTTIIKKKLSSVKHKIVHMSKTLNKSRSILTQLMFNDNVSITELNHIANALRSTTMLDSGLDTPSAQST